MKRPVTSLCRRPGKKTACGQSVPGAGTIFAHRDALRRSSGAAGQKLPGRGRKNSPRRKPGAVRRLRPWGKGGQWGLVPGKHRTGRPPGQRARPGAKTAPAEAGDCAQAAPMGERQAMGVSGAGKHHTGHPVGQRARPGVKQPPAGAGGCLDAGYGCYLPRAIRVIWMHRVGSTARPRIMPS